MRNGLLVLAFGAAIPCLVCAQNTQDKTEKTIEYPSPDGRFAFLFTRSPEGRRTVELIEKDSGRIVHRIVESEEGFGDRVTDGEHLQRARWRLGIVSRGAGAAACG